jgi:hypothetical protein
MTPATLRKHLNRLGLTQADFARLINVNVKSSSAKCAPPAFATC